MNENRSNPQREDNDQNTAPSRPAQSQDGKVDQLKEKEAEAESRQEALLDEAIEETMDASDPVSAKRIT